MSTSVVSFSFKNLIKSIEIIVNEPFITVPSFNINVLKNDIFSPVSVMISFILSIGTCVGKLAPSGIKNTLPPSVLRYFPLYSLPDTVFRTTIDFSLTVILFYFILFSSRDSFLFSSRVKLFFPSSMIINSF